MGWVQRGFSGSSHSRWTSTHEVRGISKTKARSRFYHAIHWEVQPSLSVCHWSCQYWYKKRDYFMRGLNSMLQKKMVTYYDLTLNRAVSVALTVEHKACMHQNIKRAWKGLGSRSSLGSDKCQKVVIWSANLANAPYRQTSYPIRIPIYIRPINVPNQLPPANNQTFRLPAPNSAKYPCYNCGTVGHFIIDCPYPR